MTAIPAAALRRHSRDHLAALDGCWYCGRERAVCRSKIRFPTYAQAQEWITARHESQGYAPPLLCRYRCDWCDGWHMKTTTDTIALRRIERERRKGLWARAGSR